MVDGNITWRSSDKKQSCPIGYTGRKGIIMKKWYSIIPDGSCDYAIRNNMTGEIEAIICRNYGSSPRWRRFVKGASGKYERALFAFEFNSLKSVREYYNNVHC